MDYADYADVKSMKSVAYAIVLSSGIWNALASV
jgi:hypothetical protein